MNSHILVLRPLFKNSIIFANFLTTVITKSLSSKYDYGKALVQARLIEESIYLQFKTGNVDW